jgi:hypothetical protein
MFKNLMQKIRGNMNAQQDTSKEITSTDHFTNFIDNDYVMMSVYKDSEGTIYIALNDRRDPKKCVVITAEAMYKVTDIINDVFSMKATARVDSSLN